MKRFKPKKDQPIKGLKNIQRYKRKQALSLARSATVAQIYRPFSLLHKHSLHRIFPFFIFFLSSSSPLLKKSPSLSPSVNSHNARDSRSVPWTPFFLFLFVYLFFRWKERKRKSLRKLERYYFESNSFGLLVHSFVLQNIQNATSVKLFDSFLLFLSIFVWLLRKPRLRKRKKKKDAEVFKLSSIFLYVADNRSLGYSFWSQFRFYLHKFP